MFSELNLHDRLTDCLVSMKISEPTEVQKKALPLVLEGKDVQLSSETGSGKTLVYLLPIIDRLLKKETPGTGVQALILLPTRELALQVHKLIEKLLSGTAVCSVLIIGGQEFRYQASLLRKDPEIVVATPGRLTEHLSATEDQLSQVEMLVLDEADRMLDMGFRDEVLEFVKVCPAERQTILLSATLKHRGIFHIAREILTEPEVVSLSTVHTKHSHITQQMILADHIDHKRDLLLALLESETFEKALIFANKRIHVDALCDFLDGHCRLDRIHGEVSQDDRKRIMAQFRQGAFEVLVATDVAARGLDIQGIDLVINFDMAQSGDEYVHRIGRTGRAGNTGLAISLVASYEWNLTAGIQRYLKQDFERRKVEGLVAKFTGPKKVKKSGKAAGSKAKKLAKKAAKTKVRHRDSKNVGKRREPKKPAKSQVIVEGADGLSPPKRRT